LNSQMEEKFQASIELQSTIDEKNDVK
jgi:hypothetical protein